MPTISDREVLIKELDSFLKFMAMMDEDESDDFIDVMEYRVSIEGCRYINLRTYETKKQSLNDMMWQYSDSAFRQTVRMDKASFIAILRKISPHQVFHRSTRNRYKTYYKKQTPIWIQLMVTLTRLGCHGNGVSLGRVGRNCGYSSGTVVLFTQRVFTAIKTIRKEFIFWPDANERIKISERFKNKFGIPGVGVIDGTHIILSQRPHIDGETYWCRKMFYSTNVLLVCDDTGRIRHYIIGWPGSLFDNNIFEKTNLSKHPENYFSSNEFLLADAGFALKLFCLTPYRNPAATLPENEMFNFYFSSARTIIEHVNGILKNRFSSLRGIRTQVKTKEDFVAINDHIVVCRCH